MELPQDDSDKLFQRFADEHYVSVRSFQCDHCEAILSSNELTMGRFVPPQFRLEATVTRIEHPARSFAPPHGNKIVVTVEAERARRSERA